MSREIFIDVRDLAAPEPLEKIVDLLGEVETGIYIRMLHRQRPNMLFPILKNNGFDFLIKEESGEVNVYIFLKKDRELKRELKDVCK